MRNFKIEHCKDLLNFLSDYIDGTLNTTLCQEIEAHVAECTNCRVVVDTLKKTVSLYHEMGNEPTEISSQMREKLLRTLKLIDYLQ